MLRVFGGGIEMTSSLCFLLLLFGPAMTVVGIDVLSREVIRGLVIISSAHLITIIASYYQWVSPKHRSRLWLIFPGIFSALGYVHLIFLKEDTSGTLSDRFNRIFPEH